MTHFDYMQEDNSAQMFCWTIISGVVVIDYPLIICHYLCDGISQSENSSDGQHTLYTGLALQMT